MSCYFIFFCDREERFHHQRQLMFISPFRYELTSVHKDSLRSSLVFPVRSTFPPPPRFPPRSTSPHSCPSIPAALRAPSPAPPLSPAGHLCSASLFSSWDRHTNSSPSCRPDVSPILLSRSPALQPPPRAHEPPAGLPPATADRPPREAGPAESRQRRLPAERQETAAKHAGHRFIHAAGA